MDLDPLLLSRFQFAFVVSFHAIFPVFTIGLASYIAFLETLSFKTGNPAWEQLSKFWVQVFAVVFAMGVVSGIVMSFQFGTNWSNFSYSAANFIGPVLSYEVVTAFFLEAGFLGVLLFGRDRVPKGVHLFAAYMVAIGTFVSAFWILATNSWLHTPDGTELRDGIFHVTSWYDAIFNPSFPYRFTHMAIASFLTGSFVVAGVSAWYLLNGREVESQPQGTVDVPVGDTDSGADPGGGWRPARPEHLRTSADEDRGDGGELGNPGQGSAVAVRPA